MTIGSATANIYWNSVIKAKNLRARFGEQIKDCIFI